MSFEASTLPADVAPAKEQERSSPAMAGVKPRSNRRLLRQIVQLGSIALFGLASYFIFSKFVVCSVQVQGVSMSPTLKDSQRFLLNRWIFSVRSPKIGEVVVIRDPLDDGLSVKRVIALPGDSVLFRDGQVLINGRPIEEPYLPKSTKTYPTSNLNQEKLVCGPDDYIVLGDNRNNSTDSRAYGPVRRDRIMGLVVR